MSVFRHSSYKLFLTNFIDSNPRFKRGGRIKLARALRCQPAFISQVLRGPLQLSMEQAEAASRFCALNYLETKYFLNLVAIDRAGTKELVQFLTTENLKLKKESEKLSERLNIDQHLSPENALIYYSKWHFAAIHVLITIEKFVSPDVIAQRLNLNISSVREALVFLEGTGLICKNGTDYSIGLTRIHLSAESPLINQHHMNWRIKAMESIAKDGGIDLHYSSVVTLSRDDANTIKEELVSMIKKLKERIRDSKAEEIYALCFDFFNL